MTRLAELAGARELTVNLILRDLRSKYKRSVLGWTWSLLNPLSTVIIFSIVFKFFLKIEPPVGDPSGLHNFAAFMLCGLLAYRFLSDGMTTCMEALTGNGALITKVYFPREVLVVACVGSLLVTFLIEMGVLLVILLIMGNNVIPWIPVALLIMALETAIVLGVGFLLSVLNVYVRDVKHLVTISLQALFYSAPIVYPISFVPDEAEVFGYTIPLGEIYRLNPLVTLVQATRDVLYNLTFPSIGSLLYLAAWGAGTLTVGLWVFTKLSPRLAEEV
jgi:ABC-2 type transport system permease protein